MIDAYSLDSELKIYSKADRLVALNEIIEKLGVAGSTNSKLSIDAKNSDKIYKYLYMFNTEQRRLQTIVTCNFEVESYFKYLILCNETKTKVTLLYNVCIRGTKITGVTGRGAMRTVLDKIILEAECVFKINDIWEAIRFIECSVIDIGLDEILKDMYNNDTIDKDNRPSSGRIVVDNPHFRFDK